MDNGYSQAGHLINKQIELLIKENNDSVHEIRKASPVESIPEGSLASSDEDFVIEALNPSSDNPSLIIALSRKELSPKIEMVQ